MQIIIHDHRKIFAIQKGFNEKFPYLKLEFFAKSHRPGGTSPKKLMKNSSEILSECRSIHNSGTLTVTPQMTVTDLEQNFADGYGLFVQVFRKSGNAWLETTVTDNWTLAEQNNHGEELSKLKEKVSIEKDNGWCVRRESQ
jgi:hypothetical protein